jgi:excisionase family DNA binding protein
MTEYITIKELAQRLSLSEKTVRRVLRRGELPHYRLHPRGKMLVRWSECEAWIEARRVAIDQDADARELLELLFKRT